MTTGTDSFDSSRRLPFPKQRPRLSGVIVLHHQVHEFLRLQSFIAFTDSVNVRFFSFRRTRRR